MTTDQPQPRTLEDALFEKKITIPAPNQHANAPILSPSAPSERLKKVVQAAKAPKREVNETYQPIINDVSAKTDQNAPVATASAVPEKTSAPQTPEPENSTLLAPTRPSKTAAPRPSLRAIKQLSEKQKATSVEQKKTVIAPAPPPPIPTTKETTKTTVAQKKESIMPPPSPPPTVTQKQAKPTKTMDKPKRLTAPPLISSVKAAARPTPSAYPTSAPARVPVPPALSQGLKQKKLLTTTSKTKTPRTKAPLAPPTKQLAQLMKKNTPSEAEDLPDTYIGDEVKRVVAVPPSTLAFLEKKHKQELEEKVNKEVRIDLSASKSMASLVCALAVHPGMGSEVSINDRREALSLIITKTHDLTDYICKQIRQDDFVPDYLHGTLAQEVSKHLAYQWGRGNDLEGETAKIIASELFDREGPLFNAQTYQKFSQEGRYQDIPSNKERVELEKALINALLRANSRVLSKKYTDFIFNYDDDQDMVASLRAHYANKVFLFGRKESIEVASNLTQIALAIAEQNYIHLADPDMTATWNSNAIHRAADLVLSEYDMFVERSLLLAFSEPALHEHEINNLTKSYSSVMKEIEERALNSFNLIAKTARKLLSRSAYLANQEQQKQDEDGNELNNRMPREVN